MKKSIGAKTLIFPTPVLVVGTYDDYGKPNIMTVAWGGVCCSKPPSVAISLRKATYTYNNIIKRKAFSINIPSEDYVKEADFVGIVSGRKKDKFIETKLTPVKSDIVEAPYVEEFPVILECQMTHAIEIGLHTQFIGEIKDAKIDEAVIGKNGTPNMEKIKPISFSPVSREYYLKR